MKIFTSALLREYLFIASLVLASPAPAIAVENTSNQVSTYQSSFDDYKPLADESVADWKTINAQSNGSGHAMHGMQHEMSPEQMANMPMDKVPPAMEMMGHSKMPEMGHSAMKSTPINPDMAGMKGMQHEINPEQMANMPMDKVPPAMAVMDHSKMPEMGRSAMKSMPINPDMAGMEGMDHQQMKEVAQTSQFQIIPNLHPIAVHFPIALTVIAFLFSMAAHVFRRQAWVLHLAATGHFSLWLAALGAAIAVLFGWLAFNSVNHDDAGHAAMLLHRAWAVPTAIGLVVLASWDAWKHRIGEMMSVPSLLLLAVLSSSIAVTAWLGGELVYRHGIGVLSLPANEGGHHNHTHGGQETTKQDAMHHTDEAGKPEPDGHAEHHHGDEQGEAHDHK